MKKFLKITVWPKPIIAGLTLFSGICIGIYLCRYRTPCYPHQEVISNQDALEFGKYWLLRDEQSWKYYGIKSKLELYEKLSGNDCCSVEEVDPTTHDGKKWYVVLFLKERGAYEFEYNIYFDACRSNIEEESIGNKL